MASNNSENNNTKKKAKTRSPTTLNTEVIHQLQLIEASLQNLGQLDLITQIQRDTEEAINRFQQQQHDIEQSLQAFGDFTSQHKSLLEEMNVRFSLPENVFELPALSALEAEALKIKESVNAFRQFEQLLPSFDTLHPREVINFFDEMPKQIQQTYESVEQSAWNYISILEQALIEKDKQLEQKDKQIEELLQLLDSKRKKEHKYVA